MNNLGNQSIRRIPAWPIAWLLVILGTTAFELIFTSQSVATPGTVPLSFIVVLGLPWSALFAGTGATGLGFLITYALFTWGLAVFSTLLWGRRKIKAKESNEETFAVSKSD